MRCRYVKHDGERVFIPGCMGGAHSGQAGCTCPTRGSCDEVKQYVNEIRAEARSLRKQVSELIKVADALAKIGCVHCGKRNQ
jgi:hypothetical protein